ncbi:tubulin glycylase 3A-like [Polistes fuscatus]|uniref:tubulin glycylase 3A-like n=1 Tax=Polistes fuscatus TaxID=30207 RepID=UPI001CA9E44A|nr:tubulin glycylase 3A-like [Polistes fuscatus]
MFTNMEQNSHCNNQNRFHSGLRHDTIIRGQSVATTKNKINSQQSTKRLASVSEPGATNKREEPKKSAISPKNDFLLQGLYKSKLVQVKQQRKQYEQQVLKSVIRPTNLIPSPIILNKSADKVRRPTSTRTLLNFNHNNEEKNIDKPSILSKTMKNNYQTIASIDDISDSNEEAVNNFLLPKDNLSSEESHSIIFKTNTSEEIESENKSIESKTIEMEEISVENPNIDHNGNKATYFVVQRRVEEAIKNKKIFLIRGDIPYLENSLKKRGWIKKYESRKSRHLPYGSAAITDPPSIGNIHLPDGSLNEDYVIFSVLKHISPDFIWDCRNDFVEWTGHIKPDTLLNRFEKSFIYTSKLGMATILENVHWYIEDDVASVQYPRSYNVARDKTAFTDDYRQTAAVSFLKWFIDQIEQGVNLSNKGSSPISPKQIEFAIKRCEEFIAMKNDEYLDTPEVFISSIEWDKFIDDYIMAVHHGNGIIDEESEQIDSERSSLIILYNLALETLKKVKEIDPQYELNGTRNIWILKPSNYCCGVGIAMAHKLNYIIKRVQDCARDYFIVQKYIEKPLLVRDTKFDVRQWYLVTSSYPLTIWIYKESFLRFSSRPFSFDSYHEAIHICNTAVQNKYIIPKNSIRSLDWDCEKLNEYLKTIGYTGEPWYEKIYPKICQAIIATMLAAQEHMDKRRYSFELYGADFVIMNDLSVWLIEINTNPRMHPPGTRITQRLYPNVLESLIKVIMDYPFNPNADTGDFVLAYKQMITDVQPNTGLCLTALGKSILPKSKSLQHTNWQYL